MIHPIANNRRNLILYAIFWTLIALIHGFFLYKFYNASIYLTIADSVLFNLLYGLIGLGLWFAVKYSQMETNNIGNLILNHVSAVSITLIVLLIFGYYGINSIPVINEGYTEFFRNTLIWRVITGVMEYILVVLVYYLIMYYTNFMEKFTMESELKTNIKVAELNALKSQINPHFLFNSLNSISALTVTESNKAQEMILKLSEFLRFSIAEKPDTMRSFSEEIENISKYLDIEKVRFGDRLIVKEDIAKKCLDASIPSLILQPIVENAVKHGLSESLDKVEVRITADCFQGFLKVQVENDIDEHPRKVTSGNGIGLQNIIQRLKLTFGREDLISVGSENGKFLVTITFPQNGENDTSYTN
jgi:two-component system LytT family sensor kinase